MDHPLNLLALNCFFYAKDTLLKPNFKGFSACYKFCPAMFDERKACFIFKSGLEAIQDKEYKTKPLNESELYLEEN